MPLFGKSKPKPESAQAEKPPENKDALVQDFLVIIETQATQINNLSYELKLKESVLDDCLRQLNTPQLNLAGQNNELRRKTKEVVQLKDRLHKQGNTVQPQIQNARQDLSNARLNIEKELSQQQEELAKARNLVKQQDTQLNRYSSAMSNRQAQLDEEKRESARLKDEISQARAARDAAQSQAQRDVETLGGQIDQKVQMIHELDEQVQTLTETIEQTRLALNRTRNELAQETRKARQETEESATKSQQLEFVQQQCARLQEQLCDRTVATQKSRYILGAGKDVKEEESRI